MNKINQLGRTLGRTLITNGMSILKKSFNLKPVKVNASEIEAKIGRYFKNITFHDGTYYLIPLSDWTEIIEYDWTKEQKYRKERHDCDNFTHSFSARMSEIFGINSAGSVHGHIYDVNTGKWKFGHFWNCLITPDYNIYFYDAIKNTCRLYDGSKFVIDDWEYRPLSIRLG